VLGWLVGVFLAGVMGRPRTMLQLRTRTETSFGTGAEALHSPWPARNTPPFWGEGVARLCRAAVAWWLAGLCI